MSSEWTDRDGSWVIAQPRAEPTPTTPAEEHTFHDRRVRLAGGALAASVALAVSAVGLVLNELTGQSFAVFWPVALGGPVSVFLLGYALTPALLAGRKLGRLSVVWAMTLATLVSATILTAGFLSFTGLPISRWPFEPLVWTVVLAFAGLLYTGIPMLVLIFPCALIWGRLTRRLVASGRVRDRSHLVAS